MDRSITKKNCENDVFKYLGLIKHKTRYCSVDVKGLIASSYARSLALYYYTPLLTAAIVQKSDIGDVEKRILRRIHNLPNYIAGTTIINLASR